MKMYYLVPPLLLLNLIMVNPTNSEEHSTNKISVDDNNNLMITIEENKMDTTYNMVSSHSFVNNKIESGLEPEFAPTDANRSLNMILWRQKEIPYVLYADHSKKEDILSVIHHLNRTHHVNLVPRLNQLDYIIFNTSPDCKSSLIKPEKEIQYILVGDCSKTKIANEILDVAYHFNEGFNLNSQYNDSDKLYHFTLQEHNFVNHYYNEKWSKKLFYNVRFTVFTLLYLIALAAELIVIFCLIFV